MVPPRSVKTTYLNQAGTSWPKPEPVRAAVQEALEADPARWSDRFEAAHGAIASFFGVSDPDDILLTPGATSAIAIGVADQPWQLGDRLLIGGREHLALERPALALRERGVEVLVAPGAVDGPIDLDFVQDRLQEGGVRLLAFSAACNVTGDLLPLEELVGLARRYGARCLVDGAQIAGWWSLDLAALGADMFAFAGHKGLHAPWGIGGLYMAPGTMMHTPRHHGVRARPGYCDVGSVDRAALAGLAASVHWLQSPDSAPRLARARGLADELRRAVGGWSEVTVHGAASPEARMPTVALTVQGHSAPSLARALADDHVIASGGLQCAPLAHRSLGTAPDGALRLSFGPGNRPADVDRAVDALLAVLA